MYEILQILVQSVLRYYFYFLNEKAQKKQFAQALKDNFQGVCMIPCVFYF